MDKINIVVHDSDILEGEVIQELIESKFNGLMTIAREDELIAVCIVTKQTIYLLNPRDSKTFLARILYYPGKKFTSKQEKYKRNQFYLCTVNGMMDAHLLKKHMGIRFYKQIDLPTLQAQWDLREGAANKTCEFKRGETTFKSCKAKRFDYQQLVERHLDCDIDLKFSEDELGALDFQSKLEEVAKGALLRCIYPLRSLVEKMFTKLEGQVNHIAMIGAAMATSDDHQREEYETKGDREFKELCFQFEQLESKPNV